MKYDLDTNVTVRTLKIDDSSYPCTRYINRKGEFDFQNPEMNFVSSGFSAYKSPKIIFYQTAEVKILFKFHCLKLQGPIIWNEADSPYTLPTDLYCVTHVHCKMILEDRTLFRQLNASGFHLAIVDLIANECRYVANSIIFQKHQFLICCFMGASHVPFNRVTVEFSSTNGTWMSNISVNCICVNCNTAFV